MCNSKKECMQFIHSILTVWMTREGQEQADQKKYTDIEKI